MAKVGVGKIGDCRKENQDRKIQGIGNLDRDVKRRVMQRSFRPLHPVDDAFSIRCRSTAASYQYPRIRCDFLERLGHLICLLGIHRKAKSTLSGVPHVRTSVHGTKKMGEALRLLSLDWMGKPRVGKRKHWKNFVFVPRTLVRTWDTQRVFVIPERWYRAFAYQRPQLRLM